MIKDYLDVGVRNDEQLIKMAAVFQKYVASEDRIDILKNTSGGGGILTDAEKEQLLNEVANELVKEEKIIQSSTEIDKQFDELINKTKDIKIEISGSGAK